MHVAASASVLHYADHCLKMIISFFIRRLTLAVKYVNGYVAYDIQLSIYIFSLYSEYVYIELN